MREIILVIAFLLFSSTVAQAVQVKLTLESYPPATLPIVSTVIDVPDPNDQLEISRQAVLFALSSEGWGLEDFGGVSQYREFASPGSGRLYSVIELIDVSDLLGFELNAEAIQFGLSQSGLEFHTDEWVSNPIHDFCEMADNYGVISGIMGGIWRQCAVTDWGEFRVTQVPVLNPANGHYYELFRNEVGWLEAKALAESQTFMGLQGHLTTITSQNENDFVSNNFVSLSQDIWLGGFQPLGSPEPDGNWQWVTGEPWVYTNWFPSEPNDSNQFFGNNEEHLEIRLNLASQWNDQNLNIGRFYLVEWDTPITEPIAIDIKPKYCPNKLYLNYKRNKTLKVAILGTDTFNVRDIVKSTIMLEGKKPVKTRYRDITAPSALELCDCEALHGDTYKDLVLYFKMQDIVDALGEVNNDDEILLTLTAMLQDGTEIEGSDCVVIKKKYYKKKNHKKKKKKKH